MRARTRKQRAWPVGAIVLLAVLACWVAKRPPERKQPGVAPSNVRRSGLDVDLVYQQREPVGWVFGRMIGFPGADKPLLPRQVPPLAPPPRPSSPR